MEDNLLTPATTPDSKYACSYLLLPQISPINNYDDKKPKKWYQEVQVPYFIIMISLLQIVFYCIYGPTDLLAFDPVQLPWRWWRSATYLLAHDSSAHLAMNVAIQCVLAIWLQCHQIYHPHSDFKVAIVYLVSGIGGAVGAACVQRHIIVGASGAVYGLFWSVTSYLILNFHSTKYIWQQFVSCAFIVGCDIAYNIYHVNNNCSPKISWSVHVFGSIYGAVLGYVLYASNDYKQNTYAKLMHFASTFFLCLFSMVLLVLTVQICRCSTSRYDYTFTC